MASEPLAGVVELLHVDGQRVIVRVSAMAGRQQLSALGEAANAEQAEDRARERLQHLGQTRTHARTLARGKNDDTQSQA